MAEWIPNRLAALIGPPVYGLPYRVGRLRYRRDFAAGTLGGVVATRGGQVAFDGRFDSATGYSEARDGSLYWLDLVVHTQSCGGGRRDGEAFVRGVPVGQLVAAHALRPERIDAQCGHQRGVDTA